MPKQGEVWEIRHSRKGALTVRLLQDAAGESEWLDVQLMAGRPHYMSQFPHGGKAEVGDKMTMRQCLFQWVKRRPDLEVTAE